MGLLSAARRLFGADLTRSIEYTHLNERDVEIPALLGFLEARRGTFVSVLDVGAHYSSHYYAPLVRARFPGVVYDGVDIVPDPETAGLIDTYHVGNVSEVHLGPYDLVSCVSTIEHCGITHYHREDPVAEQLAVFRRLCRLATRYVFATFPFGQEGLVADHYANITPAQLARFVASADGAVTTLFYYNEFPQGRARWRRISESSASGVPLRADRGVQCVCVLEVEKPVSSSRGLFEGITRYLSSRTRLLRLQPEVTPGSHRYSMFNTGGVEAEVGEFLYAFVKMVKPERILETGTHLGVSAMYMAQALKENGSGTLTTLEIFPAHIALARRLWGQTGTADVIEARHERSLDHRVNGELDVLFLDSEPQIRFDELVRFYPHLRPGGFILIHDLHPHLGLTNLVVGGLEHWPFGDYRAKVGPLLADFSLQTVSFRTPRGLVLFQKADDAFAHTRHLRGLR